MAALWSQPVEVRLRQICRARPADHGETIRRLETQSPPNADRRCRPPRQMVLRPESSPSRSSPQRRRTATSSDRPSDAEMEKLDCVGFAVCQIRRVRAGNRERRQETGTKNRESKIKNQKSTITNRTS